jgi:hypothetical protein
MAGRGVDVATFGFHGLDDLTSGAVARALEHHVFDQVRPAGLRLGLPPCATPHNHRQGQGLEPWHRIANDANAVA